MKKIIILSAVCLLGACATLKTSPEFVARGNGYLTDGNAAAAIKNFNKAIALNPKNMDAYEGRGTAYFVNGNYKEASEDFFVAISNNPNNSDLYTAYAAAVASMQDYDNALKALDLAEQVNPNKPEIYFSRGNIYFLQGKYDLALKNFGVLLEAYPCAELFNARAAVLLKQGKAEAAQEALAAARSGRYPETLADYARAK